MKSTEVYKLIREVVGPWCKDQGFKRTSGGLLGWHRPERNGHLVFWFQCWKSGWDPYPGSSFITEFQFADDPRPGAAINGRHRLPWFLNESELQEALAIQNSVIGALPAPPPDYVILTFGDAIAGWYKKQFLPVQKDYSKTDDIWMRYHALEDVQRWAKFLLPVLPKAIAAMCQGDPEQSAHT